MLSRRLFCGLEAARSLLVRRSYYKAKSYEYGASGTQLLFETMGERARRAAHRHPDKEFVVFHHQGIRKTFSQFYEDSRQFGAALLSLGLKPGDRVGVWGPNYYEWIVAQFATAQAGLIMVMVNPAYQSEELRFALKKVGVRALITPISHKRATITVMPAIANAKEGHGVIRSSELPEFEHLIVVGEENLYNGAWRYEDLLKAGDGSDARKLLEETEKDVRPDDAVCIQYTSGTTGNPKGATLTHCNIVNNAYLMGLRSHYHEGTHRICVPNPLYHCFGCVMGLTNALVHEQTCVFPAASFSSQTALEVAAKEKCTSIYGTPTMFIDMLSHPDLKSLDLSSVNSGLNKWRRGHVHSGYIAGAPCPVALCRRMLSELNMRNLAICYGSTELSPVTTMSFLEHDPFERIKSVGFVMDHTEVTVVDEKGRTVPRGVKGEILVRGYLVMLGYYNDEAKTAEVLGKNRWYHTGDTGSMNDDGSVNIVGRIKDMIIRGGENIYPTEIEQFLFRLPQVADAQVFGVPDAKFGEEVCAWIRLRAGREATTPDDIREACRGKISHYKIPRYILIKKEADFPMTATGKVKKFELRAISKRVGVPEETSTREVQELGLESVQSHFNE